jgi:hypothetical protein
MIIFSRFEDGEPAGFSLEKLKEILTAHECDIGKPIEGGYIPVFFPQQNGENLIGDDEGGIAVEGGEAIEFAIGRPLYDDAMKRLAFSVLTALHLCAYGDGSRLYATEPFDQSRIPEEILDDCEGGIAIVSSPDGMWWQWFDSREGLVRGGLRSSLLSGLTIGFGVRIQSVIGHLLLD